MFNYVGGVVEQRRSDGGSKCNQGRGPADRGGSSQFVDGLRSARSQGPRHHMHPVIPQCPVTACQCHGR
jgi:hypothetical protein